MINVSEIYTTAPAGFSTPLQEKTYSALAELDIPFERVETDEVITMEDCARVDEKLDMDMVKTLFLCSRKKTDFYLFITAGDKPFSAKRFKNALGVQAVSFAPPEAMTDMLGAKIGAATVFSALLDSARNVRIVFDKEVADSEWYGCSDGTTTGYMKIPTEKVIGTLLPYTKHSAEIIEV